MIHAAPLRDSTIDIAKGIAIVAIVLGHVLRGLQSSGAFDTRSTEFQLTDRILYMGHVAIFAFLAGLFIARSVETRGRGRYLRDRLVMFLYLYLLWQTIQVAVKIAMGAFVNTPPQLSDLWSFWKPEGQMWFLPFLMIGTIFAVAFKPWTPGVLSACGALLAATVSIAAWGTEGIYVGTQGIALLAFFVAGAAIGHARLRAWLAMSSTLAISGAGLLSFGLFALLVITTAAIPPTVDEATRTPGEILCGVLASVAGVLAVFAFSALLARLPNFPLLAFLGQRSLEIFLAHIVAASGARIMLLGAGIHSPAIHILAGTLAGLIFPLLLWWLSRRLHLRWLFELPLQNSRAGIWWHRAHGVPDVAPEAQRRQ